MHIATPFLSGHSTLYTPTLSLDKIICTLLVPTLYISIHLVHVAYGFQYLLVPVTFSIPIRIVLVILYDR